MRWRLPGHLSGRPTARSPANLLKAKRHYAVCFADRTEPVGEICAERSAGNGVHVPVVVKLVMCGVALGFGYAAWNVGILHGNVTVLAAVSYFTPVLSAALAVLLSSPLFLVLARRADGLRRVIALLVRTKIIPNQLSGNIHPDSK
jgi:hypothetical protein